MMKKRNKVFFKYYDESRNQKIIETSVNKLKIKRAAG